MGGKSEGGKKKGREELRKKIKSLKISTNKKITKIGVHSRRGRGIWGWGEGMRVCRVGIHPKDILLFKEVKSASHSTHGGITLTRYHCCCGANNGVGRDPVAPMVLW